jgi:hypothetical protein
MKVHDRGAQPIENVASGFDHENRLRRVLDLTLPVIETLSAGKNRSARGQPMLDQVPGNLRRLFLRIARGEYDDLVSHHTRISLTLGDAATVLGGLGALLDHAPVEQMNISIRVARITRIVRHHADRRSAAMQFA